MAENIQERLSAYGRDIDQSIEEGETMEVDYTSVSTAHRSLRRGRAVYAAAAVALVAVATITALTVGAVTQPDGDPGVAEGGDSTEAEEDADGLAPLFEPGVAEGSVEQDVAIRSGIAYDVTLDGSTGGPLCTALFVDGRPGARQCREHDDGGYLLGSTTFPGESVSYIEAVLGANAELLRVEDAEGRIYEEEAVHASDLPSLRFFVVKVPHGTPIASVTAWSEDDRLIERFDRGPGLVPSAETLRDVEESLENVGGD